MTMQLNKPIVTYVILKNKYKIQSLMVMITMNEK